MKRTTVILVCLCAVSLLAAQDALGHSREYRITNNSGAARNGLNLSIVGTGEMASLAVTGNPAGCSSPSVTTLGSSSWSISWASTCVDAGETVIVRVTTTSSTGNEISSAKWMPGSIDVQAGDIVASGAVPATSHAGLVALVIVVLTVGMVFAIRNRRASVQRAG